MQHGLENTLAPVMSASFRNWGSKDPKYKRLYNKLGEEALGMIDQGFCEIPIYNPAYFHNWYVHHHMRFYKIKDEQKRRASELAYNFLVKYCRGDLKESVSKKPRRKATT